MSLRSFLRDPSLAYYLVWFGAALLVIAVVSGLIARHLRNAQRRLQAVTLLDALARSNEWVAAQGRAVRFQADTQHRDAAVDEIRLLQRQWFPELDGAAEDLSTVHRRLGELLQEHERLRSHDPEAWLDAACDAAFMSLWREHCAIVQTMERHLFAAAQPAGAVRRHAWPA